MNVIESNSEQDTGDSYTWQRKQYWEEWGKPPEGVGPHPDRGEPSYVSWLEAKLEAVKRIMDQPWNDSHDRGHEEAFKCLARLCNLLDMNQDPETEETPSAGGVDE